MRIRRGLRQVILLAMFAVWASGCAIGPRTIRPSSLGYNEVLHDTAESELLLNLVRARYGEQPTFVEVPSVTQQYDFTGQATIQGHFRNPVFPLAESIPHWIFAGTAAERPTIVLSPKLDDVFQQRLRAPITIDSMSILVWSGWNIDTVLRVSANNINGLDNALMAGRGHPEWPADTEQFKAVTQTLKQLQLRGQVELVAILEDETEKKSKKTASVRHSRNPIRLASDSADEDKRVEAQPHVLQFAPDVVGSAEHQTLMQLLRLGESKSNYRVVEAAEGVLKIKPPYDSLVLSRRSFSEVMFFLSQGIQVPCEHIERGICHMTVMADGRVFDWNTVTGDMLFVKCQKHRPKNYEVAVKYRDHWFYIDESDLSSRYTLNLLVELYNMEVRGGGGSAVPLLTIGASGS